MNELYDLMKFVFIALTGTSLLIWLNIVVFILVSKFVNGDLELNINIPTGKISGGVKEQGENADTSTDTSDGELPFTIDLQEVNKSKRTKNFKENFQERINNLKEEQTKDDGVFSYDESTEMKMQEVLDKLNEEIGDDLPAGIEVVTNEYERSLERKR